MFINNKDNFSSAPTSPQTDETQLEDDHSLVSFGSSSNDDNDDDDNEDDEIIKTTNDDDDEDDDWHVGQDAIHSRESTPLLPMFSNNNNNNNKQSFLIPIRNKPKDYAPSSPYYHNHHRHQHPRITPAYRRQRYEDRKQVFACMLAILSGFCDVLCYHSFGCYGNMMTGNTIKLMDHLAAGRWSEATYPAILVPAYIAGAGICAWLNKLDLSFLGLGGPSHEEFSHLNPPRRLRSPQQISVLRVVALTCVVLFLLGEAIVKLYHPWIDDQWRLPLFACAFGLINAATLAAIHLVTNAVTGHWITVGLGVADDLPVLLNRQSSRVGSVTTTSTNDTQQQSSSTPAQNKRWQSSMSVAASFIGSIIFTSIIYNECLRQVKDHPNWPLAWMFTHAPPMGLVFSLLYTVLLYWYTLPPPFLQGFSSRSDFSQYYLESPIRAYLRPTATTTTYNTK